MPRTFSQKIAGFILLVGCALISIAAAGQSSSNSQQVYERNITVYKVDSCLFNVLCDIVDLDTAATWFPSNKYFYDLLAYDENDKKGYYRVISITPSRWKNTFFVGSYWGVVRIGNMSFMLRGNLNDDSTLFHRTDGQMTVCLNSTFDRREDSVSRRLKSFKSAPILHGSYKYCNGKPIELLIAVGRELPDYEMQCPESPQLARLKRLDFTRQSDYISHNGIKYIQVVVSTSKGQVNEPSESKFVILNTIADTMYVSSTVLDNDNMFYSGKNLEKKGADLVIDTYYPGFMADALHSGIKTFNFIRLLPGDSLIVNVDEKRSYATTTLKKENKTSIVF